MIGHRSGDFKKTLRLDPAPPANPSFGTKQPVFLSTSSAWGVMEGAIRNVVAKKSAELHVWARFSDKWLDVSKRCGKAAEGLQVEWGAAYPAGTD